MEKVSTSLSSLGITLVVGILLGILAHALYSGPPTAAVQAIERADDDATDSMADSAVGSIERGQEVKAPIAATGKAGRTEVMPPSGPDPDLGVLVYGRVLDDGGSPIESAYIHFTSEVTGEPAISENVKDGSYATHGLVPGPWKAFIRGDGLVEESRPVDITADAVVRRDFVVTRAFLVTVRVQTPDGQPLKKAMIAAKRMNLIQTELNAVGTQSLLERAPMTESRYHHVFGIGKWSGARFYNQRKDMSDDADVLGLLELDSPPPAYVSLMLKHHILASQQILPGQTDITFQIGMDAIEAQTANVRVKIIDRSTGMPIEEARVSITDRQTGGGGMPTGPDGTILLEHQATGLMEMDIWAKDYERYKVKLRLDPGDVDLGTIELGLPVAANFLVVDTAGRPQVASLSWTNLDRQTFPQPLMRGRTAKSNSKGVCLIGGMGHGRYLVQARVRGESLVTKVIHSDSLNDEPIRMVLEPTLPVALDNSKMSRQRILTAFIRDQQGRLVYARYISVPIHYTIRLPVGSYTFEIYEDLQRIQSGSLTVGDGSDATILVS